MRNALRSVTLGLPCGLVALLTMACLLAEDQAAPKSGVPDDAERKNIEATMALTRAAAKNYEFSVRDVEQPALPREEPILKWSNPEQGQVYGNVFLWTDRGRPVVVGSLFKCFAPHTHTSHEFHSLSAGKITGKFEMKEVWQSTQPGVIYAAVPDAPAVAATPLRRATQMKELARQFTARSIDRKEAKLELRQLPVPVYRYELDKGSAGLLDGALFVFVQGTDPELWLMLEAHQTADQNEPRWQFAMARMNSIEITAEHGGQRIWHCDRVTFQDVKTHKLAYTQFDSK